MKKKDLYFAILDAKIDADAQLPFGNPGETIGDFITLVLSDCLHRPAEDADPKILDLCQKVGIIISPNQNTEQ